MRTTLLFVLFILFVAPLCAVDFDFDRSLERFDESKYLGASVGFTHQYDDELFALDLFGEFRWEPAGFGFLLPLRWLVYDRNKDTDTVIGMPIYDWDAARDFVRIVSYAQYGHPEDEVYLFLGPHENRYIGHGTLMGGYFNEVRLNRPSRGLYALFQTDWAGGELITNDVAPPEVIGGRAYLKPWSFIDKESYANNLEIGVSWFSDILIPEQIVRDTAGERHIDRVFDSAIGLDASFRLPLFAAWHLLPYLDWNLLRFGGNGIHAGLRQNFTVPLGDRVLEITTRLEGRAYERDYSPQYFGTFYDLEREYFFGDATKYRTHASALIASGPWLMGWYGDVVFHIVGSFAVGGSFEWNEWYDAPTGEREGRFAMNLFGDLSLFDRLRLSLFFTRADAGRGDFFDLSRAPILLRIGGSFKISEYFSVALRLGNAYRVDPSAGTSGAYRSELLFDLGFSAGYGF